ncbi:ribonuclease H1 [Pieris rapae]|uniref:ribonuclease H1 n=1 Tax=Pieris rapae TaxID=64459 RepID=UPI001E27A6E6|nr:ribonuclease H1 [Pieris rapae]
MLWRVVNLQRHFLRCELWTKNNLYFIKMPFYAVAKGRTSGIFMEWSDCEAQVKGFPGARYKKFNTVVEAQDFITTNKGVSGPVKDIPPKKPKSRSSLPSKNDNNLKRNYSTSSKADDTVPRKKPKEKAKSDGFSSDDDYDLNTIVIKQLDDIEERLKGVTNRVDKIFQKNTKKVGKKTKLIQPQDLESDFKVDDDGFVQVYTDGACSSNGRSGARAGIGVYWGDGHSLNLSEPVSGRATNNCGEIQAATKAIKQAIDHGVDKLAIYTDSKFLINSVTKWMPGWKRKGWKLQSGEPVKNEMDFKDLDSVQNKINIKWNYVEAHKGIHGNEMADQLAKAGASRYGI